MEEHRDIHVVHHSNRLSVSLRAFIIYTLLSSFFLTGNGIETGYFTFYWYYPLYIVLLFTWLVQYHAIHRTVVIFLFIVVIHSVIVFFLNGIGPMKMVLQHLVNLAFSILVFSNYLRHEKFDLIEIFRKYIVVAKAIALIGFVQVALFLLGKGELFIKIFPFKTNISYRLQSVTLEPSFIAYTFAPVVFLSVYNLFNRRHFLISRWWSVLFMLAYVLTFSSVAYLSILICLLLLYFSRWTIRKLMLSGIVTALIALLAVGMYRLFPDVRLRVDDTLFGFSADIRKPEVYTTVNLSTYALLSNLYVTQEALKEKPFFGNGIGTYKAVYDRFLPADMKAYWALNRADANSMGLRLLAETGLIGLTLFFFFLYHFKASMHAGYSPEQKVLWILNNGILVLLLLSVLRNGNYTILGKMLFCLMYYLSYAFLKDSNRSDVREVIK
jgi:hypothetical protein